MASVVTPTCDLCPDEQGLVVQVGHSARWVRTETGEEVGPEEAFCTTHLAVYFREMRKAQSRIRRQPGRRQ